MQVIIIDDENKSRTILKNYLKRYCPDVEIVAEAESVKSGAKLIESTTADCVFLDIEMPDGTGFDLLERIKSLGRINVIFTTAHDQYAIKAFQYSAIDYLLKPIDPELLIQAVFKVSNDAKYTDINNRLEALISNQRVLEK